MTPDRWIVTLAGLAVIAFIVWYLWLKRARGTPAALTAAGFQEAMVLVKGGYSPDVIVVEHGKPVRLNFRREETAACSEMALFPDFNKSAHLPAGKIVAVELLPEKPGEYGFACQMNMLRGKLIVR